MNRYHPGSSTIVASRLGLAHVPAQLKVENPGLVAHYLECRRWERLIAAGQRLLTRKLG
jgi:hypothetical protein